MHNSNLLFHMARYPENEEEEEEKVPKKKRKVDVLEPIPHERFREPNDNPVQLSQEEEAQVEFVLSQYTQSDWDELVSRILSTSVDSDTPKKDLKNYRDLFYRVFCSKYKTEHAVVDRVKSLYPHARNMKEQFHTIQEKFGNLHMACVNQRLLGDDANGREVKRQLTLIGFCIKTSYEHMVLTRLLQHAHEPMTRSMLEELTPESFFQEVDLSKLKKHQQLVYFYLRKASHNHYRKDGDAIYQPRYNNQGEFVHAYEYLFDISDFVFDGLFPVELNAYWFNCLTEKPGTAKSTIATLTQLKTEWLPNLKRNELIHAFRNGLFSIERNQFFHFRATGDQNSVKQLMEIYPNCTAIKYHDMVFDEEGMDADMAKNPELGYLAIEFPEITKLLVEQGFDEEERRFILAMGGRLLVPLGKFEKWQVIPIFLGLAGTGKSLFLRLVAKCLEKRDVAILSNAGQKTFSLDGVEKSKMFLALDVTESFGDSFDQSTFQSIVSGEETSIVRKYKQPLTVVWSIHGGLAGNKLPNWQDNGGSLTRRVIVIEFLRRVAESDPHLFDKCCMRIDRFLKIVVSAYHDYVERYGGKSIKDCMPDKFLKSEKKALVELNVLGQFLSDTCDVVEFKESPNNFTTQADMLAVFQDFCRKQSIKPPKFVYTFYSGIFAKNLIKASTNAAGETIFEGVKLKEAQRAWLIKRAE